jgi:hypothetical protein
VKKAIIGLLSAVSLYGSLATAAEARVNFDIYFGIPYYNDQIGPDYRYRNGYGWYRDQPRYNARLSCREARRAVRNQGYRNVSARECSGRTYTFSATRNGRRIIVYVNARSGAVWRG